MKDTGVSPEKCHNSAGIQNLHLTEVPQGIDGETDGTCDTNVTSVSLSVMQRHLPAAIPSKHGAESGQEVHLIQHLDIYSSASDPKVPLRRELIFSLSLLLIMCAATNLDEFYIRLPTRLPHISRVNKGNLFSSHQM